MDLSLTIDAHSTVVSIKSPNGKAEQAILHAIAERELAVITSDRYDGQFTRSEPCVARLEVIPPDNLPDALARVLYRLPQVGVLAVIETILATFCSACGGRRCNGLCPHCANPKESE